MWKLLMMFSGPLSQLANSAVMTGAGYLTAYAVAHGVPATSAQVIVGGLVTAVTGAFAVATGTQTFKIGSVNSADNGVKVVPVNAAAPQVERPLT